MTSPVADQALCVSVGRDDGTIYLEANSPLTPEVAAKVAGMLTLGLKPGTYRIEAKL